MLTVELEWKKYNNFFDLWREHRQDTKRLYVIGEQHHCYIGSIGSRDGVQGLGTRYQWQYVNRARSIFGKEEDGGQPSFAGTFKNQREVSGRSILAAEALVQNECITKLGSRAVLFDPENLIKDVEVVHCGDTPSFLRKSGDDC